MAKFHISSRGEPEVCHAQIKCRLGGESDHFDNKKDASQEAERRLTEKAGGSFGNIAENTEEKASDTVDITQINYGGIEEVPEHIKKHNASIGARDVKEVKRNEKTTIGQVNNGGINPGPEIPVVKKRKNKATGYRDTTIYSPDGEKFVTIRAHEDEPQKSYAIDGTLDGEPQATSFYDMSSAVRRVDDYTRDKQGMEKSYFKKEAEAREYFAEERRQSIASQVAQADLSEQAHDAKVVSEYDQSVDEVASLVKDRYKGFRVIAQDQAYPSDDGDGKERHVIVRGQTDEVYLVQKDAKDLDGKNDIMYDVVPRESIYDGGIYMKGDTRESKVKNQLPRYLDALKKKDAEGNPNKSLYDYLT